MLPRYLSVTDFFSFFFLLKALPFSLLRNLCVYVHNYQNAESSASHLLRNVRLWGHENIDLAQHSDEMRVLFPFKITFIDATFVR